MSTTARSKLQTRAAGFPRHLLSGLLIARLVIVVLLGVLLPTQRSVHPQIFGLIVGLWIALACWTVATTVLRSRIRRWIRASSRLIHVETVIYLVVMIAAGGWRNLFYLYGWYPIGVSSVIGRRRDPLWVAALSSAWLVVAFMVWRGLGADGTATSQASVTGVVQSVFGIAVAGLAFWYVRCRVDDVSVAVDALEAAARTTEQLHRESAAAEARRTLGRDLHADLRQLFPAMLLRLRGLSAAATVQSGVLGQAVRVLDHADQLIERALDQPVSTERLGTSRSGDDWGEPRTVAAMDAVADGSGDRFLLRLGRTRQQLVRAVLVLRGVALLGLAATLLRDSHYGWPHTTAGAVIVWLMLAVWAAGASRVTLRRTGRRLAVVLACDQIFWSLACVVGFGWRDTSFYLCAAPVVIATVLLGVRAGLILATMNSAIVATSFTVLEGTAGQPSWVQPPVVSEWLPAQAGLFIAVGLFALVHRLFKDLGVAGTAYQAEIEETAALIAAETASEQRTHMLATLHHDLSGPLVEAEELVDRLHLYPPPNAPAYWDEEITSVHVMLREVRLRLAAIAGDSSPDDPQPHDLAALCQEIADQVSAQWRQPISLACTAVPFTQLAPHQVAVLGRVIREALTNACKHGHPPIHLSGRAETDGLEIIVHDHGEPFDPEQARRGHGLQTMTHDADSLGATLRHESSQIGTRLVLRLPLPSEVPGD